MKHQLPFTKNTYLIENKVNVLFEDILRMSEKEFERWVDKVRQEVVFAWDYLGLPPVGASRSVKEIADELSQLHKYPVEQFMKYDELSGQLNCIENFSAIGNGANQFFPNIFQTIMNQSIPEWRYRRKREEWEFQNNTCSTYDYFKNKKLFSRLYKQLHRNLRYDSFFAPRGFSTYALANNPDSLIETDKGEYWLRKWKNDGFIDYDVWIQEQRKRDGFDRTQHDNKKFLTINIKQLKLLVKDKVLKPTHHLTNIQPVSHYTNGQLFNIRYYAKGQRVIPKSIENSMRVGFQGSASSFHPLTAKFLIERYTEHLLPTKRKLIVYDPSMGWGGRLLGSLSSKDDRHIHYVGTDPNGDNWFGKKNSRYLALAQFYNQKCSFNRKFLNTYEFHKLPSEDIQFDTSFRKHRGKIDVVITSPPYFFREGYNTEATQSWIRYAHKDIHLWWQNWLKGFLEPTLTTAVEFLRVGGFLIWNIADFQVGNTNFPLEYESEAIIDQSKRMKLRQVYRMVLAPAPGGNREHYFNDSDGAVPTTKNFCKLSGELRKYEPIFVWEKMK